MNSSMSRTTLSLLIASLTLPLMSATPDELVHQAVVHYKNSITPNHDTTPVRAWLKQYRTVYPLTHRPLPITLIDKLSAYDMRLIYELQRIALQAGMLISRQNAFPKLTTAGNKLYAVAERLITKSTSK